MSAHSGPNAQAVDRDPTHAWTLAQRCELAEKCLPQAEYRTRLERLHGDMLAEIGQLRHALAQSGKLAEDRLQQMKTDRAQALRWRDQLDRAVFAARLRERERLRAYFMEALADKGIVWPGEVDMLYDRCFAAPYVPDEDA